MITKILSSTLMLASVAAFCQSVNEEETPSKEISELVLSAHKKLEVNKLDIKNLDAPMTVSVLNKAVLQRWDINTLEEASNQISGLHAYRQYGGFQGFNLRGFNDFVVLYDGMRDDRNSYFSVVPMGNIANVERIEVLRGPSSDMFGHSALGGILNVVRKKPSYKTKGDAKFTVGSYNTYNGALGVGGPITDKLRYRIDAATLNSKGFRGVKEDYINASAMVHYTPDNRNKFEFYYQFADNYFGGDTGIPANDNGTVLYDWISPKDNFTNPLDRMKHRSHEAYIKYTHRFLDDSQVNYKVSYSNDDYDYLMEEILSVDAVNKKVTSDVEYHFNRKNRAIVGQLDYTFGFKTFGVKHKVNAGNVLTYLDKPNFFGYPSYIVDGKKRVDIERRQMMDEFSTAFYIQDWIELTDRIKVLGGLRYTYLIGDYEKKKTPITNSFIDYQTSKVNNLTWRGAISVQTIKDFMTVYGSASSFFKPTREHNHQQGEIFEPGKGIQFETGIKLEKKDKFNATIAGFYIERDNFVVGHNSLEMLDKAISRGFEIDADAELTKGLYLKMSYSYTDAFYAKQSRLADYRYISQRDISHNRAYNVPKHSATAWINYEPQNFLKGLGIGIGGFYTDKVYQEQHNEQYLPSYTILNGTIYYQTKQNIRLGFNVENILNKTYFRSALSANDTGGMMQMYPGKDRNYRVSLSYSF